MGDANLDMFYTKNITWTRGELLWFGMPTNCISDTTDIFALSHRNAKTNLFNRSC